MIRRQHLTLKLLNLNLVKCYEFFCVGPSYSYRSLINFLFECLFISIKTEKKIHRNRSMHFCYKCRLLNVISGKDLIFFSVSGSAEEKKSGSGSDLFEMKKKIE